MTDFDKIYNDARDIDAQRDENTKRAIEYLKVKYTLEDLAVVLEQVETDFKRVIYVLEKLIIAIDEDNDLGPDNDRLKFFIKEIVDRNSLIISFLEKNYGIKEVKQELQALIDIIKDFMNFGINMISLCEMGIKKKKTLKSINEEYSILRNEFISELEKFRELLAGLNNFIALKKSAA